MTDEQRKLLENVTDWNRLSRVEGHEAVAAALAEIDRLRGALAELLETCNRVLAERTLKAEPPRPAAIVLPENLYADCEHAAQIKGISVDDFVASILMAARDASPLL